MDYSERKRDGSPQRKRPLDRIKQSLRTRRRKITNGSYTVTVSDLAGNESVKMFNLVQTDFPEYAPVQFTINGDSWSLVRNSANSAFTRTYLLMYNAQEQLVFSWMVPNDNELTVSGTIETLRSYARDVSSVQCYTENADGSAGVLLIPVNIE